MNELPKRFSPEHLKEEKAINDFRGMLDKAAESLIEQGVKFEGSENYDSIIDEAAKNAGLPIDNLNAFDIEGLRQLRNAIAMRVTGPLRIGRSTPNDMPAWRAARNAEFKMLEAVEDMETEEAEAWGKTEEAPKPEGEE